MTDGVTGPPPLPFSAVVGQDDAKLALLLAAMEPRLGGVLLRGDKGSAKTTLARGLAALLPGGAPFVELPIGATEDRVVGSLDLAAALTEGESRFRAGLLAGVDGGVLYVDEINLLPDHLVDVLLDVSVSGVNRVEREGISHTHPSRFVLVGSMNPEEGDLRPQLLDRFGLAVDVRASRDPAVRAEAVRLRLDWDRGGEVAAAGLAADQQLAEQLVKAVPAALPPELVDAVSALCVAVDAEGLRADLTICRAAAALAGWEGRALAGPDDVRRVAPLALAHRARRDPLDPPEVDEQRLQDALDEMDDHLAGNEPGGSDGEAQDDPPVDPPVDPDPEGRPGPWDDRPPRRAPVVAPTPGRGRKQVIESPSGRQIGSRVPAGPIGPVAAGATVRAVAARRAASGEHPGETAAIGSGDLREAVRVRPQARQIIVAVDASGSMGAAERMAAVKGAVLGLLRDAYQRRDLVALIAFRGEGAEVLLRPTSSVEVARARLADLATGGRTPLAAGIAAAADLAASPVRSATHRSLVVLVTDGRATAAGDGSDPWEAVEEAAVALRRRGVDAVVVDVEATAGGVSLGLGQRLADLMAARHVALRELTADAIQAAAAPPGKWPTE